MTIRKIMDKVAVAVTVICTLFLYSCDDPRYDKIFNLTIKRNNVPADAGQVFVSVESDGSWTLSLAYEDGSVPDWAQLNVTSGSGNKNNIILSYQANESEDKRGFDIIFDNGASWVKCPFWQEGKNHPVDTPVQPEPETDLSKTGWLELPAMDNEDLGYFTHSFEKGGKRYRNYSFGWSQDDLVALWVAYPLCKFYTSGSVGRTNEWAYDPLLGELSAAPFGGYAEELARGHQIPSADRQCCWEANAQTFYGTNMTPQLNAHNEGIWADLEGRVRNYAKTSDTTYVVTGVVLEGSKRKTRDSDGKSITVPTGYFKALLRYSKSSTISTWAAAAFYTEHRDYGDYTPFKDLAMSIDELEEMTGLDFFVNLPEKLGDQRAAEIEAENPLTNSVWGL